MPAINWSRILAGAAMGLVLVIAIFGAWYWYVVWTPARQAEKTAANLQQLQTSFWQQYCSTGKYKNEAVRTACLQVKP